MTNIEAKILELEGKVTLPDLHNEVVIEDGDQRVKYVADAFGIQLGGDSVHGCYTLKRYDQKKVVTITKERVGFLRYKTVEVSEIRDTLVWTAGDSNLRMKSLIIFMGKVIGVNIYTSIRNDIKANAGNDGIILSDKLLDLAFGPIEQQLFKKYQEIKDYGKSDTK